MSSKNSLSDVVPVAPCTALYRARWILIFILLSAAIAYAFFQAPSYTDLHPMWGAARASLIQHTSAYNDVLAVQEGYLFHAAVLDRSPDRYRFAYPFHTILLCAPLAWMSFRAASITAGVIGFALTLLSLKWWTGIFRIDVALLFVATYPVMRALSTQQPTLIFAALLAWGVWCLRHHHPIPSGVLFALATGKPQLLCFVAVPVIQWIVEDWRRRRWACVSFVGTSAMLFAVSLHMQPGWPAEWIRVMRIYSSYAGASIPMLLLGKWFGIVVSVLVFGLGTTAYWRLRKQPMEALSVSICTALLIVPFQDYNEIILILPLVLLFRKTSHPVPLAYLVARFTLIGIWVLTIIAVGIAFFYPTSPSIVLLIFGGLFRLLALATFAAFLQRSDAFVRLRGKLRPPHYRETQLT